MTLTTPYSATFHVGDGETKTFPYLFEEVSESFISVIVYNSLTGQSSTPTYIVDTDQKNVIFGDDTPAPTADETVCIYRNTPQVQDVAFRTLHGYDAKTLENILSKIVAMIQEIKSNYFSTQVLQGDPWQLDLLSSGDDGATVNIDYTAKKLVKGLYFRIVSGNLQVSADGSNYITMPKSADIAEFRQVQIELSDHSIVNKLQYRIGSTWFSASEYAESVSDEAVRIANEAHDFAESAVATANEANDKSDTAVDYAQQAMDFVSGVYSERHVFVLTSGQTTLQFGENISDKQIDLYWNGVLITQVGNWTVSGNTITLLFDPEEDDTIVVFLNTVRQVVNTADLNAHNTSPNAHSNMMSAHNTDLNAHTNLISAHNTNLSAHANIVSVINNRIDTVDARIDTANIDCGTLS